MNCDAECNRDEEATVFFSYIEGGKVTQVNLCKYCADERGVDDPTGYSLVDMLEGMGEQTTNHSMEEPLADELVCGACGFAQSDFKKSGRFGCAKCYDVFNEGLENLLEAMHKNTEHSGKIPSLLADHLTPVTLESVAADEMSGFKELDLDLESAEIDLSQVEPSAEMKLTMLKDKLEVAISNEDYELAAQVRDEISALEPDA